jgi:hypothetical protein
VVERGKGYPAMMRKEPSRRGNTALWKEIIESLVKVYPEVSVQNGVFDTEIVKQGCPSEDSPPTATDARVINDSSKSPISHYPWSKTKPSNSHKSKEVHYYQPRRFPYSRVYLTGLLGAT